MANDKNKLGNMSGDTRKHLTIVLVLALACFVAGPAEAEEVRSRVYSYQFETTYPQDAVMEVFYELEHFRNFAPNAEKVTLVDRMAQSYIVQYEYSYLWGYVKIRFKKSIFPNQGKVNFELVEYNSTNALFPKIVKSSGSYLVEPGQNGKNKVTYQQQFHFDKSLNWAFRTIFDTSAKRSFLGFADYIRGLETN